MADPDHADELDQLEDFDFEDDELLVGPLPEGPVLILRLASEVVAAIQDGMAVLGYTDLRPAHGFAFARISQGDATIMDVATHLGVTKQSASQLVDQLVGTGYVSRHADLDDGRVWRLRLTARGQSATEAAEEVLREVAAGWTRILGASPADALTAALRAITTPGPLRPAW